MLRAVSEYERWSTHDNVPTPREVIFHPSPCFTRDDLLWAHGAPTLTADGKYALYSSNFGLMSGGRWLGKYIQCLHVPSDTAIWQYPPTEELQLEQAIWIDHFNIQSKSCPETLENRLRISLLGTDPSTEHESM